MEDKPLKQAIPSAALHFIAMYKYNDEYYVRVKDILRNFECEYDFRVRLTDDIVKDSKIVFKVMCDGALCKPDLVSMVPVTYLGFFLGGLGLPKEDWLYVWQMTMDCYMLHRLNEDVGSEEED